MPLYIADYRNKTAHLTAAEHGAYLLLIMHYWVSKGLPADDGQVMRIAAMTPAEWKKSRSTLQAFFHDGWRHERVDSELAKADEISSKRRAAAEQRHSKKDANAEQLQCKSNHTRDVVVSSLSSSDTSFGLKEPQEEQALLRKRKNKTPLPENFEPDRKFAQKLGWDDKRIDQQIQAFCDSAKAHNRVYADWQAAWRNWCNSPYQQVNGHAANRHDDQSEQTFGTFALDRARAAGEEAES